MNDVVIIIGTEKYLVEKEIQPLLKKNVDEGTRSFNYDKFHADDTPVSKAIEACQAFPVMAGKRVVHVLGAQAWKKQEDLDLLATYLEAPNPSTLFLIEISKVDARLKVWKLAQKKGYSKEVKNPSQNELPSWITQCAKGLGLTLEEGAPAMIADQIGNQLGLIEIELNKISLSIHPRTKIEIKDIEALIGKHLIHTIFEFVDQFTSKKLGRTEQLLSEMLLMGETMPGMLALIGRHFRILMLAKELQMSRIPEFQLAGLLKVPPFVVKKYVAQATKMTLPDLKNIYQNILTTDRKVKSSPLDKRLVMDRFILEYAV